MPEPRLVAPHHFLSPLRYPGGKGMLSAFMRSLISRNDLLDGHYAEPYAGSAAIAWALLFSDHIQHVHINDLDPAIHAFWGSVLHETDALCRLISRTSISMLVWRRQRRVLELPKEYSLLERGFATFFLNRTNRSGIIRGGVIGGKEQAGKWKLDARFNRGDLIRRIQAIARYRERVTLTRLDGLTFLKKVVPSLPHRSLVYLDPPYYRKGGGLYEHHYQHEDHVAVAAVVKNLQEPAWVVSYDAAPAILRLYSGCRRRTYDLAYSAQDRYAGSEVIFFSPNLKIPHRLEPTGRAA